MRFAQNLQYLRRLRPGMTQEALAERLGVSRQAVSKWETGEALPEMDKAAELCGVFFCTMDQMFREDMGVFSEAYSGIGVRKLDGFSYVRYAVVSAQPEDDALDRVRKWAAGQGIAQPDLIGWDFPHVSPEQMSVYGMHGYAAACVLPEGFAVKDGGLPVLRQPAGEYAAITIRDPFRAPFTLIPGAYRTLMDWMRVNGHRPAGGGEGIECFERVTARDGAEVMDVYVALA
ncbi:MAG TPA: helix-turn-helix domain-containing protein [Candidatus Limnocylindria bacterium]|nr:helix-turn-helix domain-containing protein [Candidatus Limnocylindria bacterium]